MTQQLGKLTQRALKKEQRLKFFSVISVLYPGSPLHPYWEANISLRVIIYLILKVILTAHQAEFPEKSPDRVSQIAQRVENLKLRVLTWETYCVLWGYVQQLGT